MTNALTRLFGFGIGRQAVIAVVLTVATAPVWAQSGELGFETATSSVNENVGIATIPLTRTVGNSGDVSVRVRITGGTAVAGTDYGRVPGSLDTSFDVGTGFPSVAGIPVYKVIALDDGKLLVGGNFILYNGTGRQRILRLNADGTLDTTFDSASGANNDIRDMAVQPDGKIIIVGTFTSYKGVTRQRIARLEPDGALDTTFDPGSGADDFGGVIHTVTLQPDGQILIGGNFADYDGMPSNRIARVNADGSFDASFSPGTGPSGSGAVRAIAVQPDGKLLVGGVWSSFNGANHRGFVRLNDDGTLDNTFDPGAGTNLNAAVNCFILNPDDTFLMGGNFTSIGGTTRRAIAKLNSDGSLNTSFVPATFSAGSNVLDFVEQPDGRLVIGGDFTSVNGISHIGMVRLNPNGSADHTFNPAISSFHPVYSVVLLPDGRFIIGGDFTAVGGVARARLAKLHGDWEIEWADGDSADKSFDLPIIDNAVLEPDRTVEFELYAAAGGADIGAQDTHTLTILDNDSVANVLSVSSTATNGTYSIGAVVTVTVAFSAAVTVTTGGGTPTLALNSGGTAIFTGGSNTDTLTFDYTVASGENSADLDYTGTTALQLNGGTIQAAAVNADLTLPTPGTAGSLGANKNIVIDTNVPTISAVSSPTPDGTYAIGAVVTITITFSQAVVVNTGGGTPTLALNSGGSASYSSGSGSATLTFTYTVGTGDVAVDLDYTGTTALQLNGGTITGGGLPADLTLPTPGTAGSLGANKNIAVNFAQGIEIRRDATVIAAGSTDAVGDIAADGTELVLTYTVENTGASALTITAITVTGETNATATIDGTIPTTITVGNSETYTLSIIPAAVGAFSCIIEITSDLPNVPTVTFTVSGTGTAKKGGCGALPSDGEPWTWWLIVVTAIFAAACIRRFRPRQHSVGRIHEGKAISTNSAADSRPGNA